MTFRSCFSGLFIAALVGITAAACGDKEDGDDASGTGGARTGGTGGSLPASGGRATGGTGEGGEDAGGAGTTGGATPTTGGATPTTGGAGGEAPETGGAGGEAPETGGAGGAAPETGGAGGETPETGGAGGVAPETGGGGGVEGGAGGVSETGGAGGAATGGAGGGEPVAGAGGQGTAGATGEGGAGGATGETTVTITDLEDTTVLDGGTDPLDGEPTLGADQDDSDEAGQQESLFLIQPLADALADLEGQTVVSATLVLTYFTENESGTDTADELEVFAVTEAWDPGDVAYGALPSVFADPIATIPERVGDDPWADGEEVEIDVTELVQGWLAAGASFGVMVRNTGEDGADFYSADADDNAPRLEIVIAP